MEQIYEQIGQYLVTCFDNKESLEVLINELTPLLKQVNYQALTAENVMTIDSQLGLGDQAQVITSNIVTIFTLNTGKSAAMLLSGIGMGKDVIEVIDKDMSLSWVAAGVLLLGSGTLSSLKSLLSDDYTKRSNTN